MAAYARRYFERGALVQPDNPEWPLMLACCHRRSGSIQRALEIYQVWIDLPGQNLALTLYLL